MPVRVGINGFGRIGRNMLRACYEYGRDDIDIVAVNDLGDFDVLAHLVRHDTTHGPFGAEVVAGDRELQVNGDRIAFFAEADPAKIPWDSVGVDLVLESTGRFRDREPLEAHLGGSVKRVLLAAPGGKGLDYTVVYGINHAGLQASHRLISNASCTTNCLAPVVKPLHDAIGVRQGLMTTVHAYTNDQVLIDVAHRDMRRARSGTHSMIPTSTGATRALDLVLPEVAGRITGYSMRVPTINVSVVDLTFNAERPVSAEAVNEVMREAATGPLAAVLGFNEDPLVSVDFNHNPASATFDATQTQVVGDLVKILAWYDNEWGFSNRMLDVAALLGSLDMAEGQ